MTQTWSGANPSAGSRVAAYSLQHAYFGTDSHVVKVELATKTTTMLSIGAQVLGIAIEGNRGMCCTNNNRVVTFDLDSLTKTHDWTLGDFPGGQLMTCDANFAGGSEGVAYVGGMERSSFFGIQTSAGHVRKIDLADGSAIHAVVETQDQRDYTGQGTFPLASVYDSSNDRAVFGCGRGKLLVLNADGSLETLNGPLGGGNFVETIRSGDHLYVGSSIGFVTRFALDTLVPEAGYGFGSEEIGGLVLELGYLYAVSTSVVIRLDPESMLEIDRGTTSASSNLNAVAYHFGTNSLVAGEVATIHEVAATDCSLATTCMECVGRDSLCAWCPLSNACMQERECSGTWEPTCPALSMIVPSSGISDGGTLVAIETAAPAYLPSIEYMCHFHKETPVSSPATFVSSTSVECRSPPSDSALDVTVTANGALFSDTSLQFTYYFCSVGALDCSTCNTDAKPECGWCLEDKVCTGNSTCAGAWGGTACPSIAAIEPTSATVGEISRITVTGSLFVDGLTCSCDELRVPAVYVSPTQVECPLPTSDKTAFAIRLLLGEDPFTFGREPVFSYSFNATRSGGNGAITIVQQSSGDEGGGSVVALVVVFLLLLILLGVAAAVGAVYLHKQNQAKKMEPPPLTPAMLTDIAFAKVSVDKEQKRKAESLAPLADLLLGPDGADVTSLLAMYTNPSEMDRLAESLTYVFQQKNRGCELVETVIRQEIAVAKLRGNGSNTLFRTNSVSTKAFSAFARIAGTEYVYNTLGRTLNEIVQETESLEINQSKLAEGQDLTLNQYLLLSATQKVFVAILQSQDQVPPDFRRVFHTTAALLAEHFPVSADTLEEVVEANLRGELQTSRTLFESEMTDIGALPDDISRVPDLHDKIAHLVESASSLTDSLAAMEKHCTDLTAARSPHSEAAKQLAKEAEASLLRISVGGFFFLRFLVPAITSPEVYRMNVRELGSADRRLLVLVSKVLMKLSNGGHFNKKEAFMMKMNDFIDANDEKARELLLNLTEIKPPSSLQANPAQMHKDAAAGGLVWLYEYCQENLDSIMSFEAESTEDVDKFYKAGNALHAILGQIQFDLAKAERPSQSLTSRFTSLSSKDNGPVDFTQGGDSVEPTPEASMLM